MFPSISPLRLLTQLFLCRGPSFHGRYPLHHYYGLVRLPQVLPYGSPKFLTELSGRAILLYPVVCRPAQSRSLLDSFWLQTLRHPGHTKFASRGLLEGSLTLWLTRLQTWGFIWFVTSPNAHVATHLRSFHETNTFQFVSSAKLCLAHLRTGNGGRGCAEPLLVHRNADMLRGTLCCEEGRSCRSAGVWGLGGTITQHNIQGVATEWRG